MWWFEVLYCFYFEDYPPFYFNLIQNMKNINYKLLAFKVEKSLKTTLTVLFSYCIVILPKTINGFYYLSRFFMYTKIKYPRTYLLMCFILKCIVCLLLITLIKCYCFDDVLLCQPTDNDSFYYDTPPSVNYNTRPTVNYSTSGVVRQTSELFFNTAQQQQQSGAELQSTSYAQHSTIHELGVNYPNTSSVATQNNSVNSNIYEIGNNSPKSSSLETHNNSVNSNIHELGVNSDTRSSLVNASDATINNRSINSSTLAQRGGDSSVASFNVENRWNAEDYPNVSNSVGNIQSHYYSEYVIPKEGMLDRFKLGFKHLNSKVGSVESRVESIYVKYQDIGKRKLFWNIWEKNSGKYESYSDFKANWDPNLNIFKQIAKEIKHDLKYDVEDMLGVNRDSRRYIPRGFRADIEGSLRRRGARRRH